jgi:hypothetical protein
MRKKKEPNAIEGLQVRNYLVLDHNDVSTVVQATSALAALQQWQLSTEPDDGDHVRIVAISDMATFCVQCRVDFGEVLGDISQEKK